MSSKNVANIHANTIKGHGLTVGDRFHFYGMAGDPFPTIEGIRVVLGKVGNKYMLTTVTGEIMTWEFGASAKVWADTTIKHEVTTATRTLDNGDTVHTAECEHGWMTGFHTSAEDAYAVAEGHGEVSRALYVADIVAGTPDASAPFAAKWGDGVASGKVWTSGGRLVEPLPSEAEVWKGTGTTLTPVRCNRLHSGRRCDRVRRSGACPCVSLVTRPTIKHKRTKVNARRVRGGF